jgi:diguanylate cyclase (GGDEF)-like protein/PAS domain S-box-containing protein
MTTFRFDLAVNNDNAAVLSDVHRRVKGNRENSEEYRLLIVDDELHALTSLYELLRHQGLQLTIASNGAEAIGHLASRSFDLMLLDLGLEDIDGHEVMAYISEQNIDTDVIVISGKVDIDAAIGALRGGAHDFVRKPYTQAEVLNTVSNALRQRALAQTNRAMVDRLENSEKMYRYLVDSSPDIIYTLDPESHFTYVNERTCQLLGYTRDELIGQHYSMLMYEPDLERAHHVFNERRADERASRNVELRVKCGAHKNKSRRFSADVMTILLNATGMHAPGRPPRRAAFVGTYGVARDVTERKQAEEVIYHQAYHDPLTDLPNRILFKDRLGLAMIHAKRKNTELAVMFIDLDRFKLVNDTLGHVKGDDLLQQVATRLKECLRESDTLARLGGDEFTVVLPELRSPGDARVTATKLLQRLHHPFHLDGHEVHISASIGVALYPHHGESIDALLRNADIAMYQVKEQGKNGAVFYDPSMQDLSHQKVELEHGLRKALERGEFEVYYQPQIDMASGAIIGAEALIRWNHPSRGVVPPAEFLPFAEEHGLMLPITDWMLEALCRDMALWNHIGLECRKLSVNLSPQYLDRADFIDKLQNNLLCHAVKPGQIEVDITENVCLRDPQHAIEQLNKLAGLGISVAIDDFGTGYSSLAYLHRFPVRTIKIDHSFVREIHDEGGHYPVVLAIISIARGLHLNLVAEGVETEVQARYLHANGCAVMQGNLFHRPMPLGRFMDTLHARA